MALADHCVVVNEGRIEDAGPPERIYMRPATRFAASFMGESTLIGGTVAAARDELCAVETALGRLELRAAATLAANVTLAIRPEHLALHPSTGSGAAQRGLGGSAPSGQAMVSLGDATITETVFQGSFRRVLAESKREPSIRFVARLPVQAAFRAGDHVAVACLSSDIILLTR